MQPRHDAIGRQQQRLHGIVPLREPAEQLKHVRERRACECGCPQLRARVHVRGQTRDQVGGGRRGKVGAGGVQAVLEHRALDALREGRGGRPFERRERRHEALEPERMCSVLVEALVIRVEGGVWGERPQQLCHERPLATCHERQ